MALTSFYPVLCTHDIPTAHAFYTRWLGFETTFDSDWYVSLRRIDAPHQELALLDPRHSSVPEGHRESVRGVLLNLEVTDVDAEHDRLVTEGGLAPILSLRNEQFGQRHFIIEAPDGVLIDVITPIPPSESFRAQYRDQPS
ncbi:catechol 2,3-dioxygenase-like lactoylglutathione lyase family enzyme [Actinoalloteichus hoggarensis]|uniref:Glyoxalase-like domain protein n=1 Tax=Actinoalloteichus hoggarensis TaxID=1470176 RepID=A0A221WBT2_9PSEU|nr:VOC family protein [Actinoalloteichus hoggarensis]ASO23101.1 Glyoxalase-like domain protein [Actinoalloteichus hoggarensis]MBB5922706.1 catechol 2,3-dioxygenase-like lactoylglutathione lyase family enzyme [Actinoalloteichus hoggarensis]